MTVTSGHDDHPVDLGSVLHAAFRGLRQSWTAQLAPWDVTPFQWRALHTIMRSDEAVRLGVVAERLRIAPRSATEVVDQLEQRGLVERRPDPSDRRAVIVSPTTAGTTLHDGIMTERRERSDEYFAVLDPAERAQLTTLLSRLGSPE